MENLLGLMSAVSNGEWSVVQLGVTKDQLTVLVRIEGEPFSIDLGYLVGTSAGVTDG